MRAFLVAGCALAVGCSGPRAAIEIEQAHSFYVDNDSRRVVVDVELLAHDQLGGNVGGYCTRVTFPGQADPAEVCYDDLEDGDRRTVRLVSTADILDGAMIAVRVRLGDVDVGRSLVGPVKKH